MKHNNWINLIVMLGLLTSPSIIMPSIWPAARAASAVPSPSDPGALLTGGPDLDVRPVGNDAQDRTTPTDAVHYVRPGAGGACSSWANACELQTALGSAVPGDEIWVAEGTYTPGTAREDTFQLVDGVAIYGGFAGTETDRGQRDWIAHPTVLSGDVGTPGDNSDNNYCVVNGTYTGDQTVLDGFTITGGNADGADYDRKFGGGFFAYSCNATLANIVFTGNVASQRGGALYINSSSPTLINVTFEGNSAQSGGGMDNNHSNATLVNVTFSANIATGSGGGLCSWNAGTLTVTNSTFSGNSANNNGGGIYSSTPGGSCTGTLQTRIINSTLSGNSATGGGGGAYNENGVTEIAHSTITTNTAPSGTGGGVWSFNDNATCTRVGNSLIAGNVGSDVATVEITPTQRFYSLDYNLIGAAGDNVDFGLEFNRPHDQVNAANPALDPLADNGGDTLTHALQPGSPAINRIPDGVNGCGTTITTDQRGVLRISPCDIGAFEYVLWAYLPQVMRNSP